MPDSPKSDAEEQIEQDEQLDGPEEDDTSEAYTDAPADEVEDGESDLVAIPDISDTDDATPLREMVEYVARALTSNPDAVSVAEEDDGNRTVFHLSVDEKDKGKVIGRDGRVAQSIRSLLRVAATKQGTRITLEID